MTEALSASDVEHALSDLPGWGYHEAQLSKTYNFANFSEAMGFIVRVGLAAECAAHHPELFNVYSKVEISLSTHDAGNQVTQKDVDLAKTIEQLASAS